MAKQLNSYEVKLDFKADTSQAKKEIQQFQDSLIQLTTKGLGQYNFGKNITEELSKATVVTKQLQENLYTAFNTDTGKLDLGKFHESMTKAGYELKDYKSALMQFGPEGEQAFSKLARSISEAEIPLKRSNALLTEFWTTLKNTARWQISSSLLHGIMGAMSSAYGYAQDLNESLNNIRIVTGYNVDQMTDFASAANKAAQALSTTTTAYTDAALIYYQQGLSDEEVLGRTDVTIKLANVARESAETVSDQMTAVWNNFYDGSKSLEYYADVMTALGAATASSTSEISQGLEKFAAVADTVGLSYEYATAALATVTATTRQSADVVGTAFKTLFARLEQLKLGETLDDGTTLGQYSQALEKVGVNIKDSAGNLKDMDDILDELAAKWQTLAKDQQVALAQQVAGVRQYTQLIALMDNWDFMESNLEVARGAEGTLEEQANIYAESWEAAQKRVKAAAEDIYGVLLNDEFFIDLNNALAETLKYIKNFITSIGGLKGVLTSLGAIALTVFQKNIGQSLNNLTYNISMMTTAGQNRMRRVQKEAIAQTVSDTSSMGTAESATYSNIKYEEQAVKQALLEQSDKLSAVQKELYEKQIRSLEAEREKTIELAKQVDLLQDQADEQALDLDDSELKALMPERIEAIGRFEQQSGEIEQWVKALEDGMVSFDRRKDKEARGHLYRILCGEDGQGLELVKKAIPEFENDLNKLQTFLQGNNNIRTDEATGILSDLFLGGKQGDYDFRSKIDELAKEYANKEIGMRRDDWDESQNEAWLSAYTQRQEKLNQYADTLVNLGAKYKEKQDAENADVQALQSLQKSIINSINVNRTVADSITQIFGSLMSVASAINILHGLKDIWSNEDISVGQKVIQTISSTAMALGMLTRIRISDTMANLANIGASISGIPLKQAMITLNTLESKAANGNAVSHMELAAAKEAVNAASMQSLLAFAQIAIILVAVTALVYALAKAFLVQTHEIEDAEKATNTLKESYDRLKISAQEFKETISDYSEGIKALDDLTEGTKEYNDALEKSNEKARALIEKYKLFKQGPEGAGDYEYDNGRIVIHQSAIDEIQKRLDAEAAQARIGVLQSQLYTNELKQKNNTENIIKQSGGRDNFEIWNSQYQNEQYSSAEEFLANTTDKSVNEKIANNIANYNNTLEELNDEQQYLLKELAIAHFSTDKFSESLDAVAGENDKLRSAMINAQAALVNFDIDEEQLKEVTGVTGKGTLESYIRENYAGNEDIIQNILGGDLSTVNLNDENIAKILASQMSGLNTSDLDYSKDKNGKVTVKDLNGNAILNELNPEFIAQNLAKVIAQAIATTLPEELNDALLTATENLQDLSFGDELAVAFNQSVASGELNFDSLFAQITQEQHDTMTADELSQILFKGLTIDEINAIIQKLGYDNVDEYNKALAEKWAEYSSEDYENGADERGLAKAKDVGLDEDAFKIYREHLRDQYQELEDNAEAANDVAIANMRLEKGVNSIASKWEDYNEILSDSNAQFEDVAKVEGEMKEALMDMLDVDASTFELLPPDFAQKNWKLITDAVNGVEGAVDELRNKAGEEILFKTKAYLEGDEETRAKIDYLNKYIEEQDFNSEIKVGVVIEDGDFFDACQNIINEANMTAQEAQAYFASMGYDVELDEITEETPVTSSYQYRPLDLKATAQAGGVPQFGPIEDFDITNITRSTGVALKSITPNGTYGGGTGVKRKASGGGKKSSSGGGGKSSAPAENQKVTSKADAGIERYKEIDDAIQDLTKDQERLNKVTDAYYGANKVAYMKQQHKLLQKEIDLHKERFKWAQKYYDEDKAELDKYAKETLGVEIEYDEDGSIKNYTPIMEDLFSQLNEKEKYWADASHFISKEEQDEYKKANIDPIADAMKDFQKRVDTFDESNEERKEEMNKGIELMIEFKQQEYEIWQEGWKNQQDILEDQIKFLDHAKKMLRDSAADMGEALALTAGGDNTYVQNALDKLDLYKNKEQELNDLLAANKITQADYVKGMEEIRDGYLEQTENLKALDDEMMEYYGKILDKVISEIKEYTDAMDKLNSQLDRYMKVMKLTGRELDYDAIGDILEAQQKVLNDQYTTDVNTLQMLREREQHWLDELARQTTDEGRELIERQLKETREQLVETENQVLDDLAAQAEKASEILENARAKSMAVYEEMLTDGLGFDYVDGLLERQSTLQEEYLTKTNQVFETTKMLRKLQNDMDATNNRAAKQRLSNFSKEIEDLKNRESMTKADLELAQKRYDLLLAEIALEEAQKAKTTVRLQRDNEGNYGYVYTADEGDIAKAQDDLYNAENDLYNTRLRITNEYGEKIIQLNQEQADALNELWDAYYNKHSITEDEYEQKRAEIVNHYNELRKTYVHNYTAAQQNDARVVADAWINQDTRMIKSSETWQTTTDKLIAQTENAIRRYENTSSWLERQQETHFGNVEQETQKVTTASNELKDKVNEEVIPAYDDLWNKVDAVYKKYSDERKEVLENIKTYNDLAASLQTTINKYRELANVSDIKTFNSDGDVKDTGKEVKGIPLNPTQPTGNGGGGGGNNSYTGGTPSGPTALSPGEVGKYITEYAKNYSSDDYDKTGVKLSLINGIYYSKEEVRNAVANWMANHKKVKPKSNYSSGTGNAGYISGKPATRPNATPSGAVRAASGMYTGDWGDDSGKLAILHRKELVLNSHDTDNMFGIIDMVREITKTIDVNAAGVIGGYGALSSGSMNAGPQTLEQNVQITASFPNATDHNEIEEAFNNLINKASQYANRTR